MGSVTVTRRVLGFGAAAAMLAGVVTGCGSSSSKSTASPGSRSIPAGPIKLGAIYTLSGPTAAFGQADAAEEQSIVARQNSRGGIAGHQIQLTSLNDQGDPSVAVSDAEQLVNDHVAAIVYDGTSTTVQQATAVFMKAKVPVVDFAPDDTWADGSKWPYAFTDYNVLQPQGVAIAKYAHGLGASKLGILSDTTPLGEGLASDVAGAAKANGDTVVGNTTYSLTATNMTTQLQQLRSAGAESLVLPGEVGLGQVYTDLQGMNWSPHIFTEFAAYFVGYSSIGSLAAHALSTCQTDIPENQPIPAPLNDLTAYVTARTHISQPGLASSLLNANDSLLILKYAIEQAKSLNGPAIVKAIEGIHGQGFTVPQWTYTFTAADHAGWPNSSSYLCKLTPLGPYQTPYTAPNP